MAATPFNKRKWFLWLAAHNMFEPEQEIFKSEAIKKAIAFVLNPNVKNSVSFIQALTDVTFDPAAFDQILFGVDEEIKSALIALRENNWIFSDKKWKYDKRIAEFIKEAEDRGLFPEGFIPEVRLLEDGTEVFSDTPKIEEEPKTPAEGVVIPTATLESYKAKLKSMLEDVSNKLKKGNLSEDVISILSDFKRNLEKALDGADSISNEQIIPILNRLQDQRAEIYDKTGQKIGGEGALNVAEGIWQKQVEASSSQKAVGNFFFKKLPLLFAFYLMFYIPIKQNLATTEILFYILLGYAFFPTVGMKIVFFLLFLMISIFGENIIPYSDMAYSVITKYFGTGLQYVAVAIGIVLGLNWFSPMFAKYGKAKNILGAICGAITGALLIFPIIDIIMLLPSGMNQSFSCSLFCGLKDMIMQPLYGMFGAVAPVCVTTYIIGCIALIVTALVSFGNWIWKIIIYAIVFIGLPLAAPLILSGWNLMSSWGWFAGPDAVATRVLTMPALDGNLVVLLFALTPIIEITLKFLRNKADLWEYGAKEVARRNAEAREALEETRMGSLKLKVTDFFGKADERILKRIDSGIARWRQKKG